MGISNSKGPDVGRRCFFNNKLGHMKKDYYTWQRKNKEKNSSSNGNNKQKPTNYGDGYDSGDVLIISYGDIS